MRLDRFDLNLLMALDVLLQERNVTRAAERLHIGQSAASAALARLREHFADELLVRVGRQLELTPLAAHLVVPVREALQHARAAISLRAEFDPATASRRLTVCASDYAIAVLLADVVRRLADTAPGVEVELRAPPADVVDAFERGGIDLLVMPAQYTQQIDHPQQVLFEDQHACLVCASRAPGPEGLTMDDYLSRGHVAVRFGDGRSLAFEEWFLPRYGQQRRVECSVGSFGLMAALVHGTSRIATLHRRQAELLARQYPVVVVPAPFEMPPVVETLVWPRHLDGDLGHRWVREQIAQVAAALVAPASRHWS